MAAPAVAAFDFDGTFTDGDSLLRFVGWRRSRIRFAVDLLLTMHLLVLYAVRVVPNETHKMALFARRFRGMPAAEFRRLADDFAAHQVPQMIRPEAKARLRYHKGLGHRVVIVTASPTDWITPWARREGIDEVIGNVAQVRDGRMSGRLAGVNCYGQQKVERLLRSYPERAGYTLFVYGDGRGDRELLAAADEPFYRCFA